MFERYTETARRTIFFARYEASQFGSSVIDTEHLLLGMLREDRGLAVRFLGDDASSEVSGDEGKEMLPPEIAEAQRRIKQVVQRMETAIGAHDFDRAKACSDEERRERENLRQLAEKYHLTGDAGGFIPSGGRIGEVRRRIEAAIPHRPKTSTSQDLPLSQPAKRVLSLGAEEAKRMKHDRIGPEHLFLGLLREESSLAARVLSDMGLRVNKVRAEIASGPAQPDRPSSAALRDTPASGLRASGMDSMMHGLQDASRVLFLARGEASKRQNPCIETTDLLLALANEKEVNERFLGPARPAILSLASQPAPQHEHVATEELAFSKDCKLVFGYAAEEAAQLGQRTGPEHLLLGILRAETCVAAEILRASGLTASGIRAQLTLPPPSSDPEQGRNYV